ncbi:MAG: bifunctional (p)ppGpp synthetase/guanosine-3',5'-bis(diphosphate) 3'-pyrophosphohydrolase, partial [Selenomonadaceae bacterium]|nr:bifunctional (p)ppGpp synthetase/guanosine-3',5'-bis(diphosphate) 3'-pyrophosphohydrolase [Selenomonadaceae bacterium]
WINSLIENENSDDKSEIIANIKGDLSIDEIYVFTPRGDVKCLPKGATVIDFAYAIHSAVGNRMTGAKVDGRIVPLDTTLKTGQIVEILTSNQQGKGPSRDWLAIVKTSEARSKIRSWFKRERRDENIAEGKAIVEHEFRKNYIRLSELDYNKFLQKLAERQRLNHIEDFYAAIGYGGINLTRLMPSIKDEYNRTYKDTKEDKPDIKISNDSKSSSGGVIVEGIDNCLINMARCCNPLPGEPIIGFITRGHGLTIHRRDCKNVPYDVATSPEPERWVMARWDKNIKVEARSTLNIYAIDREGVVMDITSALAGAHVKIHALNAREINDGNCLTTITVAVNGREHLDGIIKMLNKIQGVYLIERTEL